MVPQDTEFGRVMLLYIRPQDERLVSALLVLSVKQSFGFSLILLLFISPSQVGIHSLPVTRYSQPA